jgi:hypothetical protein
MVNEIRGIRRNSDAVFYSSKILCDGCCKAPVCSLPQTKSCGEFIPPIGFTSPIGLTGEFSTFRIGKAWSERLLPGDKVLLFESRSKNEIGLASVVKIEYGQWDDMIERFGWSNHSVQAKNVELADVYHFLNARLERAYGRFLEKEKGISVIFLRRV